MGTASTAALTCQDWTQQGPGQFGASATSATVGCVDPGEQPGCNSTLRLYCMGRDEDRGLNRPRSRGQIYYSNATVASNNRGTSRFDAICVLEKPVGSGTFKAALLACDGPAASSVVSQDDQLRDPFRAARRYLRRPRSRRPASSPAVPACGSTPTSSFHDLSVRPRLPPLSLAPVSIRSRPPATIGAAPRGSGTCGLYQLPGSWWVELQPDLRHARPRAPHQAVTLRCDGGNPSSPICHPERRRRISDHSGGPAFFASGSRNPNIIAAL